ncbi:MAG: hypothetical protein ACSHXB_15290 [Sulfitobacter sp.]
MLDVAAQIDSSIAVVHGAPQFAPVALFDVVSDDNRETDLLKSLNRDFERHKALHGEWAERGLIERKALDQALRESQHTLDTVALVRIQMLIDGVTERAEKTAQDYARFAKSMRKIARKIARFSKPTSQSLDRWIAKTEHYLESEIDFLTETADHYAAMRTVYGPDHQTSERFDTAGDVLKFLKRPA